MEELSKAERSQKRHDDIRAKCASESSESTESQDEVGGESNEPTGEEIQEPENTPQEDSVEEEEKQSDE